MANEADLVIIGRHEKHENSHGSRVCRGIPVAMQRFICWVAVRVAVQVCGIAGGVVLDMTAQNACFGRMKGATRHEHVSLQLPFREVNLAVFRDGCLCKEQRNQGAAYLLNFWR